MALTQKQGFRTRHDSGLLSPPKPRPGSLSPSEIERVKESLTGPRQRTTQRCTCLRCAATLYYPLRHPADTSRFLNVQGLRFRSHDAWHVASRAVQYFGSFEPTTHQKSALREWKQWWHGSIASPCWSHQRHKRSRENASRSPIAPSLWSYNLSTIDINTLQRASEILDTIFFLDKLKGHIAICWSEDEEDTQRGFTKLSAKEDEMTRIVINPYSTWHRLNPRNVVCTLLHEMCHAFLHRYSCDGRCGSHSQTSCKELRSHNLGATGHGRAWQYLAKGIEMAMSRLLGFEGKLGRDECFLTELRAECGWRPSECDRRDLLGGGMEGLVSLRLDWKWVDDMEVLRRSRRTEETRKHQASRRRRRSFACGQRRNPFIWPS